MAERLKIPLFDANPPKDRREEATATAASVVLHILIILAVLALGGRKALQLAADLGAGDGMGAGLAGGGGGGGAEDAPVLITAAEEPPQAAQVEEKPVEPVPEPIPVPDPQIKPVELPAPITAPDSVPRTISVAAKGAGANPGTGAGPGTGPGTGPGSGGGSGGGEGGGIGSGIGTGTGRGRLITPSPETLLIPPQATGSVRGKSITVRIAVDETGIPREAELDPPSGDRKFDAALKRTALGWRFRPARDPSNKAVAAIFQVTFTF